MTFRFRFCSLAFMTVCMCVGVRSLFCLVLGAWFGLASSSWLVQLALWDLLSLFALLIWLALFTGEIRRGQCLLFSQSFFPSWFELIEGGEHIPRPYRDWIWLISITLFKIVLHGYDGMGWDGVGFLL
jgi:hypothetical protein